MYIPPGQHPEIPESCNSSSPMGPLAPAYLRMNSPASMKKRKRDQHPSNESNNTSEPPPLPASLSSPYTINDSKSTFPDVLSPQSPLSHFPEGSEAAYKLHPGLPTIHSHSHPHHVNNHHHHHYHAHLPHGHQTHPSSHAAHPVASSLIRKRMRRLRSPTSVYSSNNNAASGLSCTSSAKHLPHGSPAKPKKVSLDNCHICFRRPTRKEELDCYADCEACGERTCYVCLRECEGDCCGVPMSEVVSRDPSTVEPIGRRICSRCCVERGAEGEVRCFECLAKEEQMHGSE